MFRAAFDFFQDLQPMHFRQLHIQQNGGGIAWFALGVAVLPAYVVECLRTVAGHDDAIGQQGLCQGARVSSISLGFLRPTEAV